MDGAGGVKASTITTRFKRWRMLSKWMEYIFTGKNIVDYEKDSLL